ncbi:MAG: helix-turn-helix domain-containing protein [Ferruginibacter sp.]
MEHQIIHPPNYLKKWVRFFWTLDNIDKSSCAFTLKTFACRFPRLIFQHSNGHSAVSNDRNKLPVSFFSGLHSKPNSLTFSANFSLTGISFYPHALKTIFGIDCHELTDEFPCIQSFAPKWLEERLLNTPTQSDRIKIVGDFVYDMILRNGKEDLIAASSLSILNNTNNENVIQYLTKHFGISEKQLERRFKSHIGFNPKQYLRITRFEKAIERINTNRFQNLSDIAYDLNYYDQAHFIKDFKEYSGFTPLAFYKQNKNLEETSSMFIE